MAMINVNGHRTESKAMKKIKAGIRELKTDTVIMMLIAKEDVTGNKRKKSRLGLIGYAMMKHHGHLP